ncbi:MAG: hypothetical protein H0Z24_06870 [Thermosipho sp. (in: Bacteria)]|nr:hypothetical protein [Thermosipho sp. (in: thermotogales)]
MAKEFMPFDNRKQNNKEIEKRLFRSYLAGQIDESKLTHKGWKAIYQQGLDTGYFKPEDIGIDKIKRYNLKLPKIETEPIEIEPPKSSFLDKLFSDTNANTNSFSDKVNILDDMKAALNPKKDTNYMLEALNKLTNTNYNMNNKFDRLKARWKLGQLRTLQGQEYAKLAEGKPNIAKEIDKAIDDLLTKYPELTQEIKPKFNPYIAGITAGLQAGPIKLPENTAEKINALANKGLEGAAEMAPMMLGGMKEYVKAGTPAGIGAAGMVLALGQAGPQALAPEEVLTVPGAFAAGMNVAGTAASAKYIMDIEKGLAYKEMLDEGVSPDIANKWSTLIGLINAGIELSQISKLAKTIPGASKFLDYIKDKGIQKVTTNLALNFLKNVGEETLEEVAQEGTQILGSHLAKKEQGLDSKLFTKENAKRLLDTGIDSALTFAILNVPGHAIQTGININTNIQKNKALNNFKNSMNHIEKNLSNIKEFNLFKDRELSTKLATYKEVLNSALKSDILTDKLRNRAINLSQRIDDIIKNANLSDSEYKYIQGTVNNLIQGKTKENNLIESKQAESLDSPKIKGLLPKPQEGYKFKKAIKTPYTLQRDGSIIPLETEDPRAFEEYRKLEDEWLGQKWNEYMKKEGKYNELIKKGEYPKKEVTVKKIKENKIQPKDNIKEKLKEDFKTLGVANYNGKQIKLITDDFEKFTFEFIDENNIRSFPIQNKKMTYEEAIDKAVDMLINNEIKENKTVKQPKDSIQKNNNVKIVTRDRLTANVGDLIADYKARGFNKYKAWDMYIKDKQLKPEIDAKEFYKLYETVAPKLFKDNEVIIKGEIQPTHILKEKNSNIRRKIQILEEGDNYIRWIDEYGITGGTAKDSIEEFKELKTKEIENKQNEVPKDWVIRKPQKVIEGLEGDIEIYATPDQTGNHWLIKYKGKFNELTDEEFNKIKRPEEAVKETKNIEKNKTNKKEPWKMTLKEFIETRPAVEGYFYHGSPEGDLDYIDTYYHTQNWKEGLGFYTTENRDIAAEYARGRTAKGKRRKEGKSKGKINYIKHNIKPENILDMEAPMNKELWTDIIKNFDYDPEDIFRYLPENATNHDVYTELIDREVNDNMLSLPEAQYAVEESLTARGIEATMHTEGLKRGTPHKVIIFKEPDNVKLVKPEQVHREVIEKALKEGKDVPEEVLKDYPDLMKIKQQTKKENTKIDTYGKPDDMSIEEWQQLDELEKNVYIYEQEQKDLLKAISKYKDKTFSIKKDNGEYAIIHPNTKGTAKYQISFFDKKGPVGDAIANNIEEIAEKLHEYGYFEFRNNIEVPKEKTSKKVYRYYLTLRPPGPGSQPRGFIKQVSFDNKKYIDEIGKEAWGYVEYDKPIKNPESWDMVESKAKNIEKEVENKAVNDKEEVAKFIENELNVNLPEDEFFRNEFINMYNSLDIERRKRILEDTKKELEEYKNALEKLKSIDKLKDNAKDNLEKNFYYIQKQEILDKYGSIERIKEKIKMLETDMKNTENRIRIMQNIKDKGYKTIEEYINSTSKETEKEVAADKTNKEKPKEKITIDKNNPLKAIHEFNVKFKKGEDITLDEVKDIVNYLIENTGTIKMHLSKLKNKELSQMINPLVRNDYKTKKQMVDKIYTSQLIRTYLDLNDTTSYSHDFSKSIEEDFKEKLKNTLDNLTEERLKEILEKNKKRYEEKINKLKEEEKAIENPQTLEDFINAKKYRKLTKEEQDRYEDLLALEKKRKREEIKEKESQAKIEEKQKILENMPEYTVEKTKHTKTGEDIWVVKLKERIERDKWKEIDKVIRKLGGYYWKGNGGWNFKTEPKLEIEKEEKIKNNAQKLREIAKNLTKRINELKAPRQENTVRRATIAENARKEARALEQLQETMFNLADGIEKGEIKLLDKIQHKTEVEELERILYLAHNKRAREVAEKARKEGKHSFEVSELYEQERKKPIDKITIRYAELPAAKIHKELLDDIVTKGLKTKGIIKISKRLGKLIDKAKGQFVELSDSDIKDLKEIVKRIDIDYTPIEEILKSRNRLERLGIHSEEELRAYLREYLKFRAKPKDMTKEEIIKAKERELIGRKIEGYFPTPKKIVEKMIELADIKEGDKVLEPSAGMGHIADEIGIGKVDVAEFNSTLREILKLKGHNVIGNNALEIKGKYDKIIMNPPFEKGQDIEHVMYAYENNLKPGGRLVAIMSEGPFFRSDKKSKEFREWLEKVGGYSEKLPEGTFKESDRKTGVNTRIVVIDKPIEIKNEVKNNDALLTKNNIFNIINELENVTETKSRRWEKEGKVRYYFNYGNNKTIWIEPISPNKIKAGVNRPGASTELFKVFDNTDFKLTDRTSHSFTFQLKKENTDKTQETEKEIATDKTIEKNIKELDEIIDKLEKEIPKIKDINLQLFAKKQLQKYKRLREELTKKKVNKWAIKQVENLIKYKTEVVPNIKKKYEEKIKKLKEKQKEIKLKKEEREKINKYIKFLKEVSKNTKYLRPEYRKEIENLISDLDFSKPSKKTLTKLENTRKFLEEKLKDDPDFVLPERVVKSLSRLDKTPIRDLPLEEIENIVTAVAHFLKLNKLKNMLIFGNKYVNFYKMRDKVLHDISKIKPKYKLDNIVDSTADTKEKGKLGEIFTTASYDPELLAEFLGDTAHKLLYEDIDKGITEMYKLRFEIMDKVWKFNEKYDLTNWDSKKHPVELNLTNGKIKLTKAEKIELYLHTLNEDNLRSLLEGGYSFKGQERQINKLTKEDINIIRNSLTEDEKAFVKLYQEIEELTKKRLNEVSINLNGFEIARVKNYIRKKINPYTIEKDNLKPRNKFIQFTLEGRGIFKERQHSKKPLVIEGIFNTMYYQIMNATAYVGLAEPLRNAKMLLNDNKVRIKIEDHLGKDHYKYLKQYIQDIEGGMLEQSIIDNMGIDVLNKTQIAAIGANVGVMLKQTVSYIPASTEISWKYLIKAIPTKTKWDLIAKYSPQLRQRAYGYITRELAEIHNTDLVDFFFKGRKLGLKNKLIDLATIGVRYFDLQTVGRIWNAVEYEIKDKYPNLKGEEFYKKVAERTEEIVRRTQPNSSRHNRSAIGSSRSFGTRLFTQFKTQANKNYNILVRAKLRYEKSNKTPKDKMKFLNTVLTVLLLNSLALEAVNMLRNKIRKEDDEDEKSLNVIGNALSNLYYVGDIFNKAVAIYKKGIFGYSSTSTVDSLITTGIKAIADTMKAINEYQTKEIYQRGVKKGLEKYKDTFYKAADEWLITILNLNAVPYQNLKRIAKTVKVNVNESPVEKVFREYESVNKKYKDIKEKLKAEKRQPTKEEMKIMQRYAKLKGVVKIINAYERQINLIKAEKVKVKDKEKAIELLENKQTQIALNILKGQ